MFRWNSVPNLISYSRPVFIGISASISVYYNTPFWWALGLWLFLMAWFTDALDGWAAIWIGGENKYGEKVDKACDCISLIILLLVFHFYKQLPKHFYYTAFVLLLWIPRSFFIKFYPKHIVGGIVEALQMLYFVYLIYFLTLVYSEKAYGYIPEEFRLAIITIVAITLIYLKRERLTSIIKKKLNTQ